MNVRKITPEDLSPLSSLFDSYRVFYEKKSDPHGALQFLSDRLANNESVVFISTDQETITGFAQLYPLFSSTRMTRLWLLNDLFVSPKFRGKGYSKALLDRVKEHCIQTGAAGVMLETAKTNAVANALYQSSDFVLDSEHNFYNWSPHV